MAGKKRNLYLYLALACFVGIILIFVFDGYIGVYDSLSIDNGQFTQTIAAEQWQDEERFGRIQSVSVPSEGTLDFTYTVENHRFGRYRQDVSVYMEDSRGVTTELVNQGITAPGFGSGEITWSLDAAGLVPAEAGTDASYAINMVIRRGSVEREITIYINPNTFGVKPIPAPVRE